MAQGRSFEIVSMIRWIRTRRFSIKSSLSHLGSSLKHIESGLRTSVQYKELINVFQEEPSFAEAELGSWFTEAELASVVFKKRRPIVLAKSHKVAKVDRSTS